MSLVVPAVTFVSGPLLGNSLNRRRTVLFGFFSVSKHLDPIPQGGGHPDIQDRIRPETQHLTRMEWNKDGCQNTQELQTSTFLTTNKRPEHVRVV